MAEHLDTGREAEDLAASYLIEKGYEIVARNYRYGHAEVDLIIRKGIFLVFVEVKSRKNIKYGMPEAAVSKLKVSLVKRAADFFVFKTNWHKQIRFDVISIIFRPDGFDIRHFEDAFY